MLSETKTESETYTTATDETKTETRSRQTRLGQDKTRTKLMKTGGVRLRQRDKIKTDTMKFWNQSA
jgi:hypothetical protein